MAQSARPAPPGRESYSQWVRLHTLITLRWIAITGQILAVAVAMTRFGIRLDVWLCAAAIGVSAVSNILATLRFPVTQRLSETQSMLILCFDTCQLGFLLAVTGGLNNPFALLILAPATIAATALQSRATAFVGALTVILISIVARWHLPLIGPDGQAVTVPDLFGFGIWLALVIGVTFVSAYARRVASELHSMANALLATQIALAREQKLTDLGGVVAATAHELGTPLATIKLVSTELVGELTEQPALRADAQLIRQEADRCKDILQTMGRAGKDDLMMRSAPLMAVLHEAAEPHAQRGKTLHFGSFAHDDATATREPAILRLPEAIHGLRNLVQNAVDFATANVWIDADWDSSFITIYISDDGPGYPPGVIARIGDPFMRHRRTDDEAQDRPGYDGMGLGLFIAKTLLERTGATLSFANGTDPFLRADEIPSRSGAVVSLTWPRAVIEGPDRDALGENLPHAPWAGRQH